MVQLTPKKIDEIGLKPGPDGNWICCKADTAYCQFDAQVTISATYAGRDELEFPSYDWRIVEILARRPIGNFRDAYEALTGSAFKDCRNWLMEHERDNLDTHVACDYSPSSDGALADLKMAEAVT